MALLMSCRGIRKSYGDLIVLRDVSFDIAEGDRIGLVGRNGCGKTTLANILFGALDHDAGTILRFGGGMTVGYMLQSTSYSVNAMLVQDGGENPGLGEIGAKLGLRKIGEWDVGRVSGLSGGERTKLALARAWESHPDLLVLDEPTNHLDFAGVEWLVAELGRYDGTAMIISHDRYFLDRAANRTIELEEGVATPYPGSYSAYRAEKERRRAAQFAQYLSEKRQQEKVEAEIARTRGWAERAHSGAREAARRHGVLFGGKEFYRAKAKKLDRQVKSKINRLDRLKTEGVERPKDDPRVEFGFGRADRRGHRVLEARGISKRFGSRVLFDQSSFFVQRGDRIGLIGPNGCGKTTLLRMVMGQEAVDAGELWLSPSARVGYLSQDVMDMEQEGAVADIIRSLPTSMQARARTLLANMGLGVGLLSRPVGQWSLGERTRLKIARLVLDGCDVLVLDEPTNHLDLPSREELEDALGHFEGTILLVSHDRYMLDKTCESLLVFEKGAVQRVPYRFSEWLARASAARTGESGSRQEDKMRFENRMAYVLSELGRVTPGTPEYAALDAEFKELCRWKQEMNQGAQGRTAPFDL